jgi:hypothetical protein
MDFHVAHVSMMEGEKVHMLFLVLMASPLKIYPVILLIENVDVDLSEMTELILRVVIDNLF